MILDVFRLSQRPLDALIVLLPHYKVCTYLILREIIYVRVWKLHNFLVTDILREIRVGESGASKINIFIHSEVLNINFYEFLNAEIYQIS